MLLTDDVRTAKLGSLTAQERECLRLVGLQLSSKEIAHEMGISKASVDTYCNRARAKLGVTSRRDAALLVLTLETPAAAISPPAAQPPAVSQGETTVATVALLPPISSLGPVARLAIILGGAVVLALAFGMLVSGLQSLNDVAQSAAARPVAPAASKAVAGR